MSITSYAQNFEDVMLWRALGHVPNGFYIDIGAQHPVTDSVSKAFYEKGWRGIHVEATPAYAALLRQDRPDEPVIEAAVNEVHGVMEFFEIPSTGISTGDKSVALAHQERGFDVRTIAVACVTLKDIFEKTATQTIHWLKIDVESMELQVLRSWADNPARPWIVVVESTVPLTQIDNHQSWEHCLLKRDYTPVYFDGLNRYYLAHGHDELAAAFATGPNVFDGFTLHGGASAPFCVSINERHRNAQQVLQEQISTKEHEVLQLQELRAAQEAKLEKLEREWRLKLQTLTDQCLESESSHSQAANALRQLVSQSHEQAQSQAQNHLKTLSKREQAHTAQLQNLQAELLSAHQAVHQHKLALQIQTADAQKQAQTLTNAHLQALNERANEFAQQLLALHKQKEELLNKALERERELQTQSALALTTADAQARKREIEQQSKASDDLNHALRLVQDHRDAQLQSQQTREYELTAEIEELRQSIAQATAESQKHLQTWVLREQEFAKDRHELQALQTQQLLAWTVKQKDLDHEIALLKTAVQTLQDEKESFVQQHAIEIEKKEAAYQSALEDDAALQSQLKAELLSELFNNQQLSDALAEVSAELAGTRATWSWRVTAPLRALSRLVGKEPLNDLEAPAKKLNQVNTAATVPLNYRPVNVTTSLNEIPVSMPMPSQTASINPVSLNDLLECHGEDFIHQTYQTLLGRAADTEGFAYYLGRLRAGYGKQHILFQIGSSKEAQSRPKSLPGFHEFLIAHRNKNNWFARWLNKETHTQRQLNRLENLVGSLQLQVSDGNQRLLMQLGALQAMLEPLTSKQVPVENKVLEAEAIEPPVSNPDLTHLGQHAKRWLARLQLARNLA